MAESQALPRPRIPSSCDPLRSYESLEHKAQSKAAIRHETGPRGNKKCEHTCKGKTAILLTLITYQALFQAVNKQKHIESSQ